ncbi:MAG: hypothetical protein NC324_10150 [Bacteroides sp.]|nr:hypothetical protein [Bacteroides sp.]
METKNEFLAMEDGCYSMITYWDANAKIFPTYEEFINEVSPVLASDNDSGNNPETKR